MGNDNRVIKRVIKEEKASVVGGVGKNHDKIRLFIQYMEIIDFVLLERK
jgi:hypothetical protein